MQTRGKVALSKAPKGTFKRLLSYIMAEHKGKLIYVVVAMIIATVTNVFATYMIQYTIQAAVDMVASSSTDFSEVIFAISAMIVLYAISIIFTYSYLKIMISIGQDTLVRLRKGLFNHMMKLPIKYFDTHQHGDVMSRFTNDVDATRQMISQSLPQLVIALMTIVGYLTVMFITSWLLTLIMLTTALGTIIATRLLTRRSRKYFINQQKALGVVNGYIEEMVEGQKVVKVFRYEKKAVEHFKLINEDLYQNSRRAAVLVALLVPITVNLGYLSYAVVAVGGALLVSSGYPLLVSQLIAFLVFTRQFTAPLNQISQQINFVAVALAGANRIFEVLDEDVEVNDGKVVLVNVTTNNGSLTISKENTNHWAWLKEDGSLVALKGDVRFNDVTFGYLPGKDVLKNVSLFAKPGQKIAFVGSTGAGKTTITNLINRFYDISSGTITYDGIDIKQIDKASLRRSLGMVLQDTNLFTGTVMENIRYGNLNASDEDCINAAIRANADDFVRKLPEGYDTLITDNGSNLSGGQRQLLSIARAAVANPPVLILDEATSSIDTHTEKLIQNGMDQLMEGRTVFVIAHRLSTIKNAKAIIVLDFGKIIERGSHDDLINQKGRYYQLYTGAFELE